MSKTRVLRLSPSCYMAQVRDRQGLWMTVRRCLTREAADRALDGRQAKRDIMPAYWAARAARERETAQGGSV